MQTSNNLKFDIKKESIIPNTYKAEYIKSKFDLNLDKIEENFKGEINLPDKWNIGVIVGASGTGKTTIIKELFGIDKKYKYGNNPIIEEISPDNTVNDITNIFNKVGFSSPPSWLKPYSVLSNGEKMRVDLARAILSKKEIIIFDEFTSVVDRNVAKIGSYATAKYIRRENKKFIAVSCHYDILDWLEPDWIFDTNRMLFYLGKMSPNIKDHQFSLKLENVDEICGKSLASITI